jgi:subtilisin family serine protease
MVIGAVNPIPGGYTSPSDVVWSGFSSEGPTGDGRIKPDLVADGVNVLSSISTADNAYDIYSGTSMATPASCGSGFLLQQYYSQLHGTTTFLRSATLKGILIHTADEAGSYPGPDYIFGWGLIDMVRAAGVITSDNTDHSQQIIESSLVQGTHRQCNLFGGSLGEDSLYGLPSAGPILRHSMSTSLPMNRISRMWGSS